MTEIPPDLLQHGDRNQSLAYFRRERTRGFRDIGSKLYRSRRVSVPDGGSVGNYFTESLRGSPVTFQTRIRITDPDEDGAAPEGVLFGFGSTSCALVAWVTSDGTIHAVAGNPGTDATDGVIATAAFEVVVGNTLDIVVACVPGTGVLAIFVDGVLMARSQSEDDALPDGLWADDGTDGVFAAALPFEPDVVSSVVAPADFDVVQPLSIFHRQAPRHLITARV